NARLLRRRELGMQADAQRRYRGGKPRRILARRRIHQETRASEDAPAMRIEDAPIDAAGQPEIVTVDDEIAHELTSAARVPGARTTRAPARARRRPMPRDLGATRRRARWRGGRT